eukprot:TRINITY_DN3283_c0_g3_i3.p2 TRINITY_DN3283_c0_g3~~TRINITY_DN3283_c0_g3_i3.p2  ORF type:complete len:341 (+),score=93.89 TRINITY_DN3283_c0_g3_i3:1829-2851(+)
MELLRAQVARRDAEPVSLLAPLSPQQPPHSVHRVVTRAPDTEDSYTQTTELPATAAPIISSTMADTQLVQLQREHVSALQTLQMSHENTVAQLRAEHDTALSHSKLEHDKALSERTQELQQAKEKYRVEIDAIFAQESREPLQQRITELQEELRAMSDQVSTVVEQKDALQQAAEGMRQELMSVVAENAQLRERTPMTSDDAWFEMQERHADELSEMTLRRGELQQQLWEMQRASSESTAAFCAQFAQNEAEISELRTEGDLHRQNYRELEQAYKTLQATLAARDATLHDVMQSHLEGQKKLIQRHDAEVGELHATIRQLYAEIAEQRAMVRAQKLLSKR